MILLASTVRMSPQHGQLECVHPAPALQPLIDAPTETFASGSGGLKMIVDDTPSGVKQDPGFLDGQGTSQVPFRTGGDVDGAGGVPTSSLAVPIHTRSTTRVATST